MGYLKEYSKFLSGVGAFLLVFVKIMMSANVYLQKRSEGESWLLDLTWHHRC